MSPVTTMHAVENTPLISSIQISKHILEVGQADIKALAYYISLELQQVHLHS
jgi:hypothetical protein